MIMGFIIAITMAWTGIIFWLGWRARTRSERNFWIQYGWCPTCRMFTPQALTEIHDLVAGPPLLTWEEATQAYMERREK